MGSRERSRQGNQEQPIADQGQLWMIRHQEHDEQAFPALVKANAATVYGYLVRCGVAPADRDDLFQEIFTRVHRGAASYERSRPFKPWLLAITVNTVRSHFRAHPPDEPCEVAVLERYRAAGEPQPPSLLEARETAAWLEQELGKLSVPEREVLILCAIERRALSEVAELLHLPVNTIKTHLRRGRLALAQALVRRKRRLEREVTR
ncbi:MAG: RNA polymerase sigma factor [Bradymonadales bacterium]|nr:RNA polymerase sigma factor [Bradymonadales bacterium]